MNDIQNKPNIRQDYILIVDLTFNGVICSADNSTIASAVSMGYTNMSYFSYPTYTEHVSDLHKNGSFDDINSHYMIPDTWTIVEMIEDKITPEWINFRSEVITRKKAHDNLDRFCRSALVKAIDNDFMSSNLSFLMNELALSDVNSKQYTDAIKFYASITYCDDATAYHEIKMLVDSANQRKHRIFSLYMKHRTLINLAPLSELDSIILSLRKELYENSWV